MIVLAVDTATAGCSVAIVDGDKTLAEINLITGQTHSKHLMPAIERVLVLAAVTVSDLEGLAVSIGPGSFTGLRIGISTVKGLAVARNLPLAGVSTLEVLANQAAVPNFIVCPVLDARKHEVYFSSYRLSGGHLLQTGPETVTTPLNVLKMVTEPCVFVGNGALLYRDLLIGPEHPKHHLAPPAQHFIRATTIAQLGLPKLLGGDTMDAATMEPVYIRKSDAQLHRNQRSRKKAVKT